jgi:hypothetical protein
MPIILTGSVPHLRELGAQIRGAPRMPDGVVAAQTTAEALSRRQFGNWTTDAGEIDTALFIGTREEPLDYDNLAQGADEAVWKALLGYARVSTPRPEPRLTARRSHSGT